MIKKHLIKKYSKKSMENRHLFRYKKAIKYFGITPNEESMNSVDNSNLKNQLLKISKSCSSKF